MKKGWRMMLNFENAIPQARQLAQSPEGKQLAALLQQLSGKDLQQAVNQAAAGDFSQARQTLAALLEDPQARQLLEKLGERYGK